MPARCLQTPIRWPRNDRVRAASLQTCAVAAVSSSPPGISLLLLHDALQRMLVFSRKVHHLRHLGFGDLVRKNAAFADAVMVDMKHDAGRRFAVLVEETLQHV